MIVWVSIILCGYKVPNTTKHRGIFDGKFRQKDNSIKRKIPSKGFWRKIPSWVWSWEVKLSLKLKFLTKLSTKKSVKNPMQILRNFRQPFWVTFDLFSRLFFKGFSTDLVFKGFLTDSVFKGFLTKFYLKSVKNIKHI